MVRLFHYVVATKDFLGVSSEKEMTVIAKDETEARDEVASYFSMHDEITEWSIAKTIEDRELPPDDPFALDYAAKGSHSYIS